MHILSLFPKLLFLGLLAPTILRFVVSIIGLISGYKRYKNKYRWSSILYLIPSIFILLGLYTQAFALVGIAVIAFEYYAERKTQELSGEKKIIQILVGVILLSLIFTGPGFIAFDLPL